jgi:hypothetical protein
MELKSLQGFSVFWLRVGCPVGSVFGFRLHVAHSGFIGPVPQNGFQFLGSTPHSSEVELTLSTIKNKEHVLQHSDTSTFKLAEPFLKTHSLVSFFVLHRRQLTKDDGQSRSTYLLSD